MTDAQTNRRRHQRLGIHLPIRISTIDPEREPVSGRPFFRTFQEISANVSRGGVFVRTTNSISPGRRVLLELNLPNRSPIEAVGRVAWSKTALTPRGTRNESGIGIQFLPDGCSGFAKLEEYLASCEREAP